MNTVEWSDDGALLISGSDDQTVALWGLATGFKARSARRPATVPCSPARECMRRRNPRLYFMPLAPPLTECCAMAQNVSGE